MNKKAALFWTFFKVGITTFGGGYAMISLMKEEIVDKKKWITDSELLDVISIAESTPGPIAVNLSTYVGYRYGGFFGSLFATLGVTIPSLVIIFFVSLVFNQFMENQYINYAFVGIKCAVAFLLLKAAFNMIKTLDKSIFSFLLIVIATSVMLLIDYFAISFSSIYLILIGGILGLFSFFLQELKVKMRKEKK